jgi:RHS repeat-associated protein
LRLTEHHIYGSARLGIQTYDIDENSLTSNTFGNEIGDKHYELSNHLGNVVSVISDRKLAKFDNGIFTKFTPDVLSFSDYMPFGMVMPNRNGGEGYRYGFQGQEKDDEVKGSGNSIDFGARMYDPRIGRFIALDPKWREYVFQSPYAYAVNNPIRYKDEFGEGPGDRVKAAKKLLNKPYKKQTELELRTGTSVKALEFMDCSELICRVLAADEFTDGVDNMPTSTSVMQNWLKANWKETDTPKKGDVIVWNGHTALVRADYEEGDKYIKVIHATKYTKKNSGEKVNGVVEEKYKVTYYKGNKAKYYTPVNDKPDGDLASDKIDKVNTKKTPKEGIQSFKKNLKELRGNWKELRKVFKESKEKKKALNEKKETAT